MIYSKKNYMLVEQFDRLLYNGSKESYEKQISFPEINSSEMKFILKYVYINHRRIFNIV